MSSVLCMIFGTVLAFISGFWNEVVFEAILKRLSTSLLISILLGKTYPMLEGPNLFDVSFTT